MMHVYVHICMYTYVCIQVYMQVDTTQLNRLYSLVSDKKVTQRKIEWNRKV